MYGSGKKRVLSFLRLHVKRVQGMVRGCSSTALELHVTKTARRLLAECNDVQQRQLAEKVVPDWLTDEVVRESWVGERVVLEHPLPPPPLPPQAVDAEEAAPVTPPRRPVNATMRGCDCFYSEKKTTIKEYAKKLQDTATWKATAWSKVLKHTMWLLWKRLSPQGKLEYKMKGMTRSIGSRCRLDCGRFGRALAEMSVDDLPLLSLVTPVKFKGRDARRLEFKRLASLGQGLLDATRTDAARNSCAQRLVKQAGMLIELFALLSCVVRK